MTTESHAFTSWIRAPFTTSVACLLLGCGSSDVDGRDGSIGTLGHGGGADDAGTQSTGGNPQTHGSGSASSGAPQVSGSSGGSSGTSTRQDAGAGGSSDPATSGGASNAVETGGLEASGGRHGAQTSGGSAPTGGKASTSTGGSTSAGGSVSAGGAEVPPHGGPAAGGPQAGRNPLGGGGGLGEAGTFSSAGSPSSDDTPSAGSGGTPTTQGGAAGTAGFAGGTAPDDEAWLSEILVPETGALLGLYYGDESIARTGEKIGRVPPLHLTYYAFEDDWTYGPTLDDLRNGRIPFVNWELYGTELSDIIAGDYNDMLAERAAAVADLGTRFFVDFGAEMNGEWSPWGGAQNGQSAEIYLAAYRHVHDAMVAGGATNLIWAWCPNVTDEPRTAWNAAMNYYPGDDYVDWTCVDGYNWGGQSFSEVFRDIYPTLASVGKPIMIGEMSCTEDGDKGPWIDAIVPALRDEFPLIRGLIWFDIDKEEDWRISSSPDAEAAFARMAMDPYMNP